jgi:hypothetical protein
VLVVDDAGVLSDEVSVDSFFFVLDAGSDEDLAARASVL